MLLLYPRKDVLPGLDVVVVVEQVVEQAVEQVVEYSYSALTSLKDCSQFPSSHSADNNLQDLKNIFKEKWQKSTLKFAAAYWNPSAGAEATGGKFFPPERIFFIYSMLITLSEGW